MSPDSTVRRVRNADAVGRLRARSNYYLWFGGQVHAKHLLVFAHFGLLAVAIWLLCEASSTNYSAVNVPGLDGLHPFDFDSGQPSQDKTVSLSRSDSSTVVRPFLTTSRNVVSILGYLYLCSTLLGLIALRAVDTVWKRTSSSSISCTRGTLLLIPFLLSWVSLGGSLFIWTVRGVQLQLRIIGEVKEDESFAQAVVGTVFVLLLLGAFYAPARIMYWNSSDAIRFNIIPYAIVWALYLYFIYGCMLGFVYVHRRSRHWVLQRNSGGTVNSTSWSFRDRNSLASKSSGQLKIKQGLFARYANRSWHSYKCENPSLRGYSKKTEDSISCASDEGSIISASESENNNLSRSFCGLNSSHRLLATVHEENESLESTLVSSSTSNVGTRM
ncbi:hypothetical protein Q1695_009412 [Nippostrongylus brasiliensis]|nr:hypothetical protein Q1695_009412 [Nippostrongylus brasiliensis]